MDNLTKRARGKYYKYDAPRNPGSSPGQPASHGDKKNVATRSASREAARLTNKLVRREGKREIREEST